MKREISMYIFVLSMLFPLACTKRVPLYCGQDKDCPPKWMCDPELQICIPPSSERFDGGPDSKPQKDSSLKDTKEIKDTSLENIKDTGAENIIIKDASEEKEKEISVPKCSKSTDCKNPTPICINGTCQKCTKGKECLEAQGGYDQCFKGSCVQCLSSSHCKEPFICDPIQHQCRSCKRDTECREIYPKRPYCLQGICSQCNSDDHCLDSQKSHCIKGICVECGSNKHCQNPEPICDTKTLSCRACKYDEECPYFCHQTSGVCPQEDEIIFVESCRNGGEGTKEDPYCKIREAIEDVSAQRYYIWIKKGLYRENIVLEDTTVVIRGEPGTTIRAKNNKRSVIEVKEEVAAHIEGIKLEGGKFGINCSEVYSLVSINRVFVTNNRNGGLHIWRCSFIITNNIVVKNGFREMMGGGSECGGVELGPISEGYKVFFNNTVVQNKARRFIPGGVVCFGDVNIVNTILWDNLGRETNCSPYFSIIHDLPYTTPDDRGNFRANPLFINPAQNNFHIRPSSPAVDRGTSDGAPLYDFDNQPRPQGDGIDIGADESR